MSAAAAAQPASSLLCHFLVVRVQESIPPNPVAPLVTYHLAAAGAAAFPPDTPNFIYPDACVLRRLEFEEYDGEAFTFTLTDESGGRLFGYTRRFLPVGSVPRYPDALCILSRHAWPALFHELLEHVQVRWLLQPGAAFALMEAALNAPMPRPGMHFCLSLEAASATAAPACAPMNAKREQLVLARAEDSCSSAWPLLPLSRHLSVDNLLLLLSALLCEQRIVFVSRHLSRLSACIHAAVALLQPLQWQHILVPLLPRHLLSYCSAPMPFIIGLHAEYLSELLALPGLDELLIVSLDSGRISSSHDVHTQSRAAEPGDEIVEGRFSFPLPDEIATKLKKQLKEIKWGQTGECDEQDVFEALMTFQLQLFGHADWAAPLDPRGKFNIEGFVQTVAAVAPHNHDFFTHAMHSQCVERFMQQQCDKWRAGNGRGATNSNGGVLSPADRFERVRLEVLSAAAGSNPSAPYADLFSFSFVLKRVHAHLDAALGIVINQSALAAATAVGANLPRFVGAAETRKLALELTSNSPLPSSRGTPRDLLSQLTLLSFDCRAFEPLMRVVWERLADCKKKNHSHGHKALVLLQHMLENGSDRVILHTLFAAHAQTVLQSLAYNYCNENERVQELIRAAGLRIQTLLGNVFLLRRTRRYARIVDLRRYRYCGVDRPRVQTGASAADAGLLCDPDWDEFRHRSLVEMMLPALPPFKQLHARYQTEFAEPQPLRTPSSARAAAGAAFHSPPTSGSNSSAAPPSGQASFASHFDFSGFASPTDAEDPFAGPPGILAILPPEAHVPSIHEADFGFASERPGPLAIMPPKELAHIAHPESQSARNTPVPSRSMPPTAAAALSTPPVIRSISGPISRPHPSTPPRHATIIDTSIFATPTVPAPASASTVAPVSVGVAGAAAPLPRSQPASKGASPLAPTRVTSVAAAVIPSSPWAAFDDAFAETAPATAAVSVTAPVGTSSLASNGSGFPVATAPVPAVVDPTVGLDLFFTPAPAATVAAAAVGANEEEEERRRKKEKKAAKKLMEQGSR